MKTEKLSAPKLIYGVGVNDADYVVIKWKTLGYVNGKKKRKLIWFCPYHRAWKSMLERCYSAKLQERKPTYRGCTASEEWKTFSNFKKLDGEARLGGEATG